jgi:hypothetical protein
MGVRSLHPVQWLADNGSAYTPRETIDAVFHPSAQPGKQMA